jgi:hypothetical protein
VCTPPLPRCRRASLVSGRNAAPDLAAATSLASRLLWYPCAMLEIRWTIGDVNPRGLEAPRLRRGNAWSLLGSKVKDWVSAWLADDRDRSRLLARRITSSLGQFGSVCRARALDGDMPRSPAGSERAGCIVRDVHAVTRIRGLDPDTTHSGLDVSGELAAVCAHATGSGIAQDVINQWGSGRSCTETGDR